MPDLLLAALSWDPQIRGFLIFLASVVILPGSVYLLLATNVGARLGFMLAVAGIAGWCAVMGVVWAVFGIGLRGEEPHWEIEELFTGSAEVATVEAMEGFPNSNGWTPLAPGDKELADAQAAADKVLGPDAATGGGSAHGGGGDEGLTPEERLRFPSPFKEPSDYVVVGGFRKGGDNELFTIGRHKFFFRHSPHYAVVQVQPVVETVVPKGGVPPRPQPDLTAPITSVVMLRNLGNLRQTPALFALCSFLVFAVTCWSLHERDKEVMRARGLVPA